MPPSPSPSSDPDPFTTLLHIEDTLYSSAYTLGQNAGSRAGKIEGRIFGLEKGFEKFAALGNLHGRSVVWGARLPSPTSQASREGSKIEEQRNGTERVELEEKDRKEEERKQDEVEHPLPSLPPLPRLPPHITLLHSLTDPLTFSTSNTEDAVADLDDRYKRGTAKAKIIDLLIKEPSSAAALETFGEGDEGRRKGGIKGVGGGVRKEDNMEDFGGSRLVR